MKTKYLLPFIALAIVCSLGLFYNPQLANVTTANLNSADIAWMLTASALVLLMTPGLSFFYGGMVSKKNIISTMLQSFIALGVITILWYFVGFSLSFGDSWHGLIGNPTTFFMFKNVGANVNTNLAPTIPLLLFALFQMKFAIITPALITGSFAERVRFNAYLLFICLFSLFIYAPLAHWTWHPDGFLHKWGILDFAGGTAGTHERRLCRPCGRYDTGAPDIFWRHKQTFGAGKHSFCNTWYRYAVVWLVWV